MSGCATRAAGASSDTGGLGILGTVLAIPVLARLLDAGAAAYCIYT
jgi:hypothetical protein